MGKLLRPLHDHLHRYKHAQIHSTLTQTVTVRHLLLLQALIDLGHLKLPARVRLTWKSERMIVTAKTVNCNKSSLIHSANHLPVLPQDLVPKRARQDCLCQARLIPSILLTRWKARRTLHFILPPPMKAPVRGLSRQTVAPVPRAVAHNGLYRSLGTHRCRPPPMGS